MKTNNILVIGADTCIGYALCKRFLIDRQFCVYGINVEFNHYGNQSFKYARKRNMFEREELNKEECIQYLSSQTYNAIYWCIDILSEDNLSESKRRFYEYQQILSNIKYHTIYFFKDKYCLFHGDEKLSLFGKIIIISIPEIYGIYQTIEHIVPQIILEQKLSDDLDMEKYIELISAWSLAILLKEQMYSDIEKYTLHLKKIDLYNIISELKRKDSSDNDYCEQILQANNVGSVNQSIYYMLEAIEFYISNKMYYEREESR